MRKQKFRWTKCWETARIKMVKFHSICSFIGLQPGGNGRSHLAPMEEIGILLQLEVFISV